MDKSIDNNGSTFSHADAVTILLLQEICDGEGIGPDSTSLLTQIFKQHPDLPGEYIYINRYKQKQRKIIMKSQSETEKEMREEKAPTPGAIEELSEYITSLVDRKHDYGTCVYAMSLAATATFNYVARNLGVTGFQASCADLDVMRRTRAMDCPFILLKAEDMIYPQFNLPANLQEAMQEWVVWCSEECARKLANNKQEDIHPKVWAHWVALANKQADVPNEAP